MMRRSIALIAGAARSVTAFAAAAAAAADKMKSGAAARDARVAAWRFDFFRRAMWQAWLQSGGWRRSRQARAYKPNGKRECARRMRQGMHYQQYWSHRSGCAVSRHLFAGATWIGGAS